MMPNPVERMFRPPMQVIEGSQGQNGENDQLPKAHLFPAIPLTDFSVPPDNDKSILLGNRYICRGDGAIWVSSSGMGKSSLSLQAAVTWALDRPFMDVKPNGPLSSLIFQSEDSDGDIGEVWASLCYKMGLTDADKAIVKERVKIVTDKVNRGLQFIGSLEKHLATCNPDLVWINPLAAFMNGDNTVAEVAGDFLRSGLNALNPNRFAYMIVQHTTKPPTGKDRSERRWHEIMYDMAGSYDIIGWARAIISLRPTDTEGQFNLVLAKRGRRAGVTKKIPQGVGYRLEASITIPLQHCRDTMPVPGLSRELPVIFWEQRTDEPSSSEPNPVGRPKKHVIDPYLPIFPRDKASALGIRELYRLCVQIKPLSQGTLFTLLQDSVETGKLLRNSSDPSFPKYYLAVPKPAGSLYED